MSRDEILKIIRSSRKQFGMEPGHTSRTGDKQQERSITASLRPGEAIATIDNIIHLQEIERSKTHYDATLNIKKNVVYKANYTELVQELTNASHYSKTAGILIFFVPRNLIQDLKRIIKYLEKTKYAPVQQYYVLFPSKLTLQETEQLPCKALIQTMPLSKGGMLHTVNILQPRNCNHHANGFATGQEHFFVDENGIALNLPVQAMTFKLLAHSIAKATQQVPLIVERRLLEEYRDAQLLTPGDELYITNPTFKL